mmetsp:Transcript_81852/g.132770  ORF Transcript_81852/g.132770 Transcript_81852/m.132770 type:complete len:98 (+) Transcript_81852:2011-2304(+)
MPFSALHQPSVLAGEGAAGGINMGAAPDIKTRADINKASGGGDTRDKGARGGDKGARGGRDKTKPDISCNPNQACCATRLRNKTPIKMPNKTPDYAS